MICFMSTKTFLNQFTSDFNSKEILECNYIPVSTRIRFNDEIQVMKCPLYSEKAIFALTGEKTDEEMIYRELFKDPKKLVFLTDMMTYAIIEERNIILLCSVNEMKTGYLEILCKVISEIFEYPIIDYKKHRKELDSFSYNPTVVAKKIKKVKNTITKLLYQSKDNRNKALKYMDKKDMKKELKKLNMYTKNMSKSEMVDLLKFYFVENVD